MQYELGCNTDCSDGYFVVFFRPSSSISNHVMDFFPTLYAINSSQIKISFDETPGFMQPNRQEA